MLEKENKPTHSTNCIIPVGVCQTRGVGSHLTSLCFQVSSIKAKHVTCSLLIPQDWAERTYEQRLGELLEGMEESEHSVHCEGRSLETGKPSTVYGEGRNENTLHGNMKSPPIWWKPCSEDQRREGAMNASGGCKSNGDEKSELVPGSSSWQALRRLSTVSG